MQQLLGAVLAGRLCYYYGGSRIEVPRLVALGIKQRDEKIRELLKNGVPTSVVARDFDLTERHVRRIRAARGDGERPS